MPTSSAAWKAASGGLKEWKRTWLMPQALLILEDLLPVGDVGGRIAGQREVAAVVGAAHEDRPAVDTGCRALGRNLDEAERELARASWRFVSALQG
jgi:hypothetical protein